MAMKYLRIIIKQNFIQSIEWLKHQTKGIRKKVKLYVELVLNDRRCEFYLYSFENLTQRRFHKKNVYDSLLNEYS